MAYTTFTGSFKFSNKVKKDSGDEVATNIMEEELQRVKVPFLLGD